MSDEKDLVGMYNRQELIDTLFTREIIVNPITFQPVVHIKAMVTMELMQDLNANMELDELKILLGEAVLSASIVN